MTGEHPIIVQGHARQGALQQEISPKGSQGGEDRGVAHGPIRSQDVGSQTIEPCDGRGPCRNNL